MDFLRGDFKCWASLLGTCKYVHSHHVDNLVELKILWEKAQRKRALYNCYFYSTIYLQHNNIGAEGAKYVAEALKVNTSLTKIDLRWNNIGDEGAKYVAEALKVNTSLTKINLFHNNIGAEGAKYVAEALKVNTSLTNIRLGWNNIGAEGKHSLREAWKHSDGLRL